MEQPVILDPEGEPIPPERARLCAECDVHDDVDSGATCAACGHWFHDVCADWSQPCAEHRICMDCDLDDDPKTGRERCPACIEGEADRIDIQGSIDFARRGQ